MRLSPYPVGRRVLRGAFSRLEPCAVKVARTVLRGQGGGNATLLPDVSESHFRSERLGQLDLFEHAIRRVAGQDLVIDRQAALGDGTVPDLVVMLTWSVICAPGRGEETL